MTDSPQAPRSQAPRSQPLSQPSRLLQPLLDRVRTVFPEPIDTALLHDGGDDFRAVEINGTWIYRLAPPTTVVHGDLCLADHVFYDAERQGLCGVIDFGDLTRDDPAQDFLDVLDQGGPAFFERTAENYAGEAGERLLERVRLRLQVRPLFDAAYALEHGFIKRLGQRLEEIEAAFGA